jgi:RNA polymerase sigma factor (sigma-70 family)
MISPQESFCSKAESMRPYLVAYAEHATNSFDDAEDITQDALLNAWQFYQSERGSPESWIYAIAKNAVATALKSKIRLEERQNAVERTFAGVSHDTIFSGNEPYKFLLINSTMSNIFNSIDQLREQDRRHLELGLEGASVGDLAAEFGTTDTAAKVRAFRIRARLRKILLEDFGLNQQEIFEDLQQA